VNIEEHAFPPKKAARYLGISNDTLRLWRSQRKGPPFFKAGEKLIRYRKADLDAWIEEHLAMQVNLA